jgi:hypothetical protein
MIDLSEDLDALSSKLEQIFGADAEIELVSEDEWDNRAFRLTDK